MSKPQSDKKQIQSDSPESDLRDVSEETIVTAGQETSVDFDELLQKTRSVEEDPVVNEKHCQDLMDRLKDVNEIRRLAKAMEADESSASEPKILGQFELLESLGGGGMGQVFRARHSRLGKIQAVKVLHSHKLADKAATDRFYQEMRAIGQLHHPNIVSAQHADEADGVPYLVMDYVDGKSLSQLIRHEKSHENGMPVAAACELVRQAALGIQYAHDQGVVHRDIKPGNIMLDRFGVVRVLDLGLARITSQDESTTDLPELTTDQQILGTPDYMAPEQLRNSRSVDGQTDLYALGATLFYLLSGRVLYPSEGGSSSLLEKAMQIMNDPVPDIRELRPGVPQELADLVTKCLQKDPQDRVSSAGELADQLNQWSSADALQTLMPEAEPNEDISLAPTRIAEQASSSKRKPSQRKQNQRPLKAIGLALALVGVFAAAMIIHIKTDYGELVVTSEDENVEFTVKRHNGEPVDGFELTSGKGQKKLRTGKYEVILTGTNADEFKITDNSVTLSRGNTAIVTIERRVKEAVEKTPNTVTPQIATEQWQPTPEQHAFFDSMAKLKPEQQVEAVRERLKLVNPEFDGKVEHKIVDSRVVDLQFFTGQVTDIWPVRALPDLLHLDCSSVQGKGRLADLSPLSGMKLTTLICDFTAVSDLFPLRGMPLMALHCGGTQVTDFSPLKGMPLQELYCPRSQISDLSPLRGMPLTVVSCSLTQVADLSPLKGMKLTNLDCYRTGVSDLSPLKGMPLQNLSCNPELVAKHAVLLRDMKTLKTINGQPAAEFWKKNASGSTSKPPAMAKVDTANPPRIKQNIVGRPSDAELLKRLSAVDWQPGGAAKLEGYASFPSKLPGISFDWQILPKFSQHRYGYDISPKGTYIAVYHDQTYDPYIRIMERKTGRLVGMFHNRGRYDRRIGWSPDESKFIVSWWNWRLLRSTVCRLDGTILAEWSYKTEEDHSTPVPAWSPDGSRILLVRSKSLEQRTPDGNIVESFVSPGHGGSVHPSFRNTVWSPDGSRFAIMSDGEVLVYTKEGGQPITVLKGEDGLSLRYCVWHPSGEKILTHDSQTNAVRLWTLSGDFIRFGNDKPWKPWEQFRDFSPDGRFIVTSTGHIRDLTDRIVSSLDITNLGKFDVSHGRVHAHWIDSDRLIFFSSDKGSGYSAEYSPSGKMLAEFDHPIPIPQNALSWMNTPEQFLSIGTATSRSWNFTWGTESKRDKSVKHSKSLRGFVAYSQAKQQYAGTNDNSPTYVFDEMGKQQGTIKAAGSSRLCSWSPDGALLATAPGYSSGGPIEIWRGEEKIASFEGHKHEILGLSWSPDGAFLTVWDSGLKVSIWDIKAPEKPVTQKKSHGLQLVQSNNHWSFNISCPRWSPDGNWLAVLTENAVLLVSPAGDEDITVPMKKEDLGVIWWSPDGQALIVGKTRYDLDGKIIGKLGDDNSSIPFLNWLSDEKLVTAWHRGVGIYHDVDQHATVLSLPGFSGDMTPPVSMLSRGMNAKRVSKDERYLIHHSGWVRTGPNSYGGGDIYLIDLQKKRHLWTGLAYNNGTQVRIEPTGRVQTVPEDFDKYLTYIISYSTGPTIPQTKIQFASRINLSAEQQLVQQTLDLGGNVNVVGQDAPLIASDISDARDLPSIEDVTSLDLSENRYLNDDGLKHLGELTSLEELHLQNTSTTNKGLTGISKLKRLRVLNLSGLNVTNSVGTLLPGNLEELDVSHTEIGDFFLFDLKTFKSLKRVVFTGTKVTPAGIASLKQALPDCEIIASQVPKTETASDQ